MGEFLSFNKMLTPTIIKIVFFVECALSIIVGLVMFFSGLSNDFGGGLQVFMGIVIIVAGPFVSRISCELLIVLFKMHENLRIIARNVEENNSTVKPTQPTTRSASSEQANI